MPNWCQNNVTFSHTEKAMIDRIYNAADDGKLFRSFLCHNNYQIPRRVIWVMITNNKSY